jgi:hypothetical protein
MTGALWFVVVGALLVGMVGASTLLTRLPLTTALLYLGAGAALGPLGLGLIRLEPVRDSALLERLAEVAVLVSLFGAGGSSCAPRSPTGGGASPCCSRPCRCRSRWPSWPPSAWAGSGCR